MKKLIVVLAIALFAGVQAHAQFLADAGYIHAFETVKTGSNGKGVETLDGFYSGGKIRFTLDGITEGLSIDPGINVSVLFGRDNGIQSPVVQNAFMTEVALNVPVFVNYNLYLTDGLSMMAFAGPTFQYGIIFYGIDGTTNPTDLYNYYKSIPSGPIDARTHANIFLGLGVGLEIAERVQVFTGFDYGLLNLSTGATTSIHRGQVKAGLGYIF